MFTMLVLGLARPGHAYIDPGTGMTFVSGIGAFIAGIFAVAFGAIAMTFRRWVKACKAAVVAVKRLFGGRNPA
jgi:hypothetical protein